MKKSVLSVSALLAAGTLSIAGCAKAPDAGSSGSSTTSATESSTTSATSATDTSSGSSATDSATDSTTGSASGSAKGFKACMVSDTGGFDDKSFNQTSLAGMTKAATEFGIQTAKVQSQADTDYAGNVNSLIKANCTIIIGVGYKLTDAITAAAKANPSVEFAVVDPGSTIAATNVRQLDFNTAQSSFLAGYLAASMTKTGKVGTFGGMKIPTVTVFMDGFAQGVQYYNQQKGKSVAVLGWSIDKQDGQFVSGGFGDLAGGQTVAKSLIAQGADIVFPVAGGSGIGALQAANASGGKVSAIWVDTDGYNTNPTLKGVIMSSVVKGMDTAVYDTIKAAVNGKFSNDPYVGTLANGGTGLAPFHDFDSKVSASVKSELAQIKADIISGKITITSKSQPK